MIWPFDLKSGRLPNGITWQEVPWIHAPPELFKAYSLARFCLKPSKVVWRELTDSRVRALAAGLEAIREKL